MTKFLISRRHLNDITAYVAEKEAADSDEEFNIFDMLGVGMDDSNLRKTLEGMFQSKVREVDEEIKKEEVPSEWHALETLGENYLLDENNYDKALESMSPEGRKSDKIPLKNKKPWDSEIVRKK